MRGFYVYSGKTLFFGTKGCAYEKCWFYINSSLVCFFLTLFFLFFFFCLLVLWFSYEKVYCAFGGYILCFIFLLFDRRSIDFAGILGELVRQTMNCKN